MRNYKDIPIWKKVTRKEWGSWKWQINHVVTTLADLEKIIDLTKTQRQGVLKATKYLKMRISPHILTLMDPKDTDDPLRRQFIPSGEEVESIDNKMLFNDVNADNRYSPVEGLIHRYPSKVLLFPSNYCGSYCRYCFRRKLIRDKEVVLPKDKYNPIFEYIQNNPKIEEVILSGGDPLVLDDDLLDYIFRNLSKIAHVSIVRIHTRLPVTIPYRITTKLVSILAKYKPIYVVIHIDSPKEISLPMKKAVSKLVDHGIPCLASCPLLRGINDSEAVLRQLWTELVKMRIKPYYLFHSDPVKGLLHYLVPLKRGIEIMRNLYDNMSGLAVPHYCFNIPGGGGHILIDMNCIKEIDDNKYEITNFEGKKFIYNDMGIFKRQLG